MQLVRWERSSFQEVRRVLALVQLGEPEERLSMGVDPCAGYQVHQSLVRQEDRACFHWSSLG